MFRLAFCLILAFGGAAMAAPKNTPDYSPFGQVPTGTGATRDRDEQPSDAELALQMWRQHMGDTPMPENLRRKYGIPDNPQQRR